MSADAQPAAEWLDEFAAIAPRSIHPSRSVVVPFTRNRGQVNQTGRRRTALLHGRRQESALLDGLLARARDGDGGVLVLRGEAGFGKTALLEHAIQSASDLRVLRAVGVKSDVELAFAALHQLCAPVLDGLDRLPGPQRDALAITFGLHAGPVPDRFLVGPATLSLLSEAAKECPMLCVIDDAEWLDRASAQALAFVARRLQTESLVMLFAARTPTAELACLPDLVVEGLDDADARMLLASVIPGRFDQRVAEQLVAEAQGNPLALLELPRGLSPSQLAGGFGLPRALSLESPIEQSLWHRLEALPSDTRRLLLVAAAEPTGDPVLLRRAAERLHISGGVLDAAETAGLIEVDSGRVRFRHPRVRSLLYRAATPQHRSQAHRALAEVTDAQLDPDRRAWHLADATGGPDEDVAAELERAAGRAQVRAGLAAAAAFLERAAALTPEAARRARRALAAAESKLEAGALDDALTLLATAEAGALGELELARLDLLRAQIAFVSSRGSDASPLLLKAARRLEPLDSALSRETYRDALSAAIFAGRLATAGGSSMEVARAASVAPAPQQPPRAHDLLLDGLATLFCEGYAPAVPILREAQSAFGTEMSAAEQLRWLWPATTSAVHLWDDGRCETLSQRHVQLARETGALGELPLALSQRVYVHLFAGELTAAASLAEEIHAATEATGGNLAPYAAVGLAALRGREAEAAALIDVTRTGVTQRGEGIGLTVLDWAEAVLSNGLGRYEDARAAALRVVEHPHDPGVSNWGQVELVEAAVRCGDYELAGHAHHLLAERARASATEWALGVHARSRALLSDGDAVDSLYREAIERLQRTRLRVDLARTHLLYGEWLRRERRRVDAREQLNTALAMFTNMGTEAFAGRAERELLATGERVRRRSVETRDELTAQEAQIARLARDGLSNAEIGARLFISPHTVAHHLRKVFSKLVITSRNQLNQVLPDGSNPRQTA